MTLKEPTNEFVVNSKNKTLKNKSKKILKGGASQAENIEIDDEWFYETIFREGIRKKMVIHFIKMELPKQFISSNKIVKSNTVKDLKYFNSQSSTTQAKKGEQLVFYDACY